MNNPTVDNTRTLTLICASIQTYLAYGAGDAFSSEPLKYMTPPPGTRFVDSWFGQDVFDGQPIHKLVLFGLIFEYTEDPGRYIFAFRGTEGIGEWLDDLDTNLDPFKPFKPHAGESHMPDDAQVEGGFNEIYASMQQALFAKLDELKPSHLEITGHSLGSALATLFTLDVVLSRPGQSYVSENFASPRVGDAAWASNYEGVTKGNPTTRVVNSKDLVPKVPPAALGYEHIGVEFKICFDSPTGFFPDFGLRHSSDNYHQMLDKDLGVSCDCRLEGSPVKLHRC